MSEIRFSNTVMKWRRCHQLLTSLRAYAPLQSAAAGRGSGHAATAVQQQPCTQQASRSSSQACKSLLQARLASWRERTRCARPPKSGVTARRQPKPSSAYAYRINMPRRPVSWYSCAENLRAWQITLMLARAPGRCAASQPSCSSARESFTVAVNINTQPGKPGPLLQAIRKALWDSRTRCQPGAWCGGASARRTRRCPSPA